MEATVGSPGNQTNNDFHQPIVTMSRLSYLEGDATAQRLGSVPEEFGDTDLAYLLSQYLHGEHYAIQVAQMMQRGGMAASDQDLVAKARKLGKEEERHFLLFSEYLNQNLEVFEHHQETAQLFAELLSQPSWVPAATVLHTVVEPFGLGSILSVKPYLNDNRLLSLLKIVAEDEADHLQLGHDVGSEFPHNELVSWVKRAITALIHSTTGRPVFCQVFPTYWQADIFNHYALNSPFYDRQAKRVAALILTQVKRTKGLRDFYPEIRDHLQQEFEANRNKIPQGEVLSTYKPKSAHPHYDDGNALFAEVIGPTMAYSCANWLPGDDLDRAQTRKFERIAAYSGIQEETRKVMDLGCGWGGYIDFLQNRFGNLQQIDGMTVAKEQADWFNSERAGPKSRVWTGSCFDYLEQTETVYDAASAIESLEHFACAKDYAKGRHRHIYGNFFRLVNSRLEGRLGLETIVATAKMADLEPRLAKKALQFALFMLRRVYPDSHLSSPEDIVAAAAPYFEIETFQVHHLDYAKTCAEWRKRLDMVADRYDPKRVETYRRYFDMCVEQFESQSIGLLQASLVARK